MNRTWSTHRALQRQAREERRADVAEQRRARADERFARRSLIFVGIFIMSVFGLLGYDVWRSHQERLARATFDRTLTDMRVNAFNAASGLARTKAVAAFPEDP